MDLRTPQTANDPVRTPVRRLNSEAPWDAFDPAAYVDHNYGSLRSDDAKILEIVRKHFADHFRDSPDHGGERLRGIDVGAGANLYPALSMLPWCGEITLFETSTANVAYLNDQRVSYDPHWDQFWAALCEQDVYARRVADPRADFRRAVTVERGNLFDLRRRPAGWQIGTMFFVAESMSTSEAEFFLAVERFMEALAPGAPFAAAFMEGSLGYKVGEHSFPACSVSAADVRKSLSPFAEGEEVAITPIGMPGGALREGYEGMIVACGRRGSE
ncbi:SCO2525 family SAM-dependent methyltransferase [Streptomyces sp. NBC_01477]|uniref:SCO2525 family SAM-dependent methyltransferase n=1 Tax=Streptomyces sp. NBC_01477 TaxID=2976015 RepID=UPI002E30B756|nr:SCO2525 family SAM-dependent methyltransferase [Streptomyces sp. NBC_01477]